MIKSGEKFGSANTLIVIENDIDFVSDCVKGDVLSAQGWQSLFAAVIPDVGLISFWHQSHPWLSGGFNTKYDSAASSIVQSDNCASTR